MVGINLKKVCLLLLSTFIIEYFFILHTYVNCSSYVSLLNVQFLNFRVLTEYQISRFPIEFLIPFFLNFYIIYNFQIKYLSVQVSYIGMYMHKRTKKVILREIIDQSLKDNGIIFGTIMLIVMLICVLDFIIYQNSITNITDVMCILIYLFRFMVLEVGSIVSLRILALYRNLHFEVIIPYISFVICLMMDFMFNCHLITYSNDLFIEFVYMLMECLVVAIMIKINCHLYRKGEM